MSSILSVWDHSAPPLLSLRLYVCVCMCVCVRARACACVCVHVGVHCVCACMQKPHAGFCKQCLKGSLGSLSTYIFQKAEEENISLLLFLSLMLISLPEAFRQPYHMKPELMWILHCGRSKKAPRNVCSDRGHLLMISNQPKIIFLRSCMTEGGGGEETERERERLIMREKERWKD